MTLYVGVALKNLFLALNVYSLAIYCFIVKFSNLNLCFLALKPTLHFFTKYFGKSNIADILVASKQQNELL